MKLIIIVVVAMVIGGAGAFAAMKFIFAPPAQEAASADEFSQTASTSHGGESEEPIVAPTKGEAPAGGGGGHGGSAEGGEGEGAAEVDGPQTVDLKPFSTNLNENSGRRYLKVTISMEVDNKAAVDELNRLMPDIQDRILMQLSSLSSQDVATVEGKERLRSQILRLTNQVMVTNKVKKVKYSEFIIQ